MNEIRREIYHYVLQQITSGEFSEGDRIPTEMELAERFDTNRMNAHFAVKKLEEEDIVRRQKGQGTFVKQDLPSRRLLRLRNQSADRVHVVASPRKSQLIHWNETTLQQLESMLRRRGFRIFHSELPAEPTRGDLEELFGDIKDIASLATIFLPGGGESQFLRDNLDVMLDYEGDIYLFDRGAVLFTEWPFHSVRLDPFAEGVKVGRYLYDGGHRHIAFVQSEEMKDLYWSRERKKGLRMELKRLSEGSTRPEIWQVQPEELPDGTCERIQSARWTPTLVMQNDALAGKVMDRAEELSLRAGEDFHLISFDNSPTYRSYNLTTVAPPLQKIGSLLGRLVCEEQWMLKEGNRISVKVPSQVIERETCRPLQPATAGTA
jgi:DNA-binding LacI/PurR family transcriptional regulator